MRKKTNYNSNLNDAEWNIIRPFLFPERPRPLGGRPFDYEPREIVNACFYLLRTGCQWRNLPGDFPPPAVVFHHFNKWRKKGIWEKINEVLTRVVRKEAGREEEPSVAIIDSQSVKTGEQNCDKGYDAGKKVKGRKRHILTDVMGLILAVVVHTADIQDRDGAKLVLEPLEYSRPRLELILADSGYAGELEEWVSELRDDDSEIELQIVRRSPEDKGFKLLPWRWIVERTLSWISKNRRMSKDYEVYTATSETFTYMAMCRIMLNRLAG
jgi:putative transposase